MAKVVKVIELLSESPKSWEDAAQAVVSEASKTLRNIRSVYVKEFTAAVENKKVTAYRVNAKAAGRWHAVLEREQKFLVDLLRFFASLLEQTLPLRKRIVKLAIARRNLRAVNDQLEDIDKRIIFAVLFRQRHQFFRAMRDEKRIDCLLFDEFFEDMLCNFEIGELRQNFHAEFARSALASLFAGKLEPICSGDFAH